MWGKCPSPHPLLDASGVAALSPCRLAGSGRCKGQVREVTQSRDPRAACQPRQPQEVPARPAACGPAPPDTHRMNGFHSEEEEERESERASKRQREAFGKTERWTKRQTQRRAPGEKDPRLLVSAPAERRGWDQGASSATPSAPTGSASLRAAPRSPESRELGLPPSAAHVWPWPTSELWSACAAGVSCATAAPSGRQIRWPEKKWVSSLQLGLGSHKWMGSIWVCAALGRLDSRLSLPRPPVQPSGAKPGSSPPACSSALVPSRLSTPHGMWPRTHLLADPSSPSEPSLR